MKLLITGGAGYVGSHMVKYAQEQGHEVYVLDNFSSGHRWACSNCKVFNVDLLDARRVFQIFTDNSIDAVIHFAGKSIVSESVLNPSYYYENNVIGTLNLLEAMIKSCVEKIVFSSSAAIFGIPNKECIDESHQKLPINPYGQSKLIVENILNDYVNAYGIKATALRYFNAAGAHHSSQIGEAHDPETHLIPNVLKAALEETAVLKIFGNKHSTKDGTCIRDYVHVSDLAEAHMLALRFMTDNDGFHAFNLGNGNGFSVFEIIKSCELITGKDINIEICHPREGDPSSLVADSALAKNNLEWLPQYTKIEKIIETAWKWHKSREV